MPQSTVTSTPALRSRRLRFLRRLGLALVLVVGTWVTLIAYPQPLFAYQARQANIVLHARSPLPVEATPLLTEVVARVSRSPLYDARRVQHVFLCDTPALFGLFTLWNWKVGGVANTNLGSNIFIRPSNVRRRRIIGPSGDEKKGERTLDYYIAHEVTHLMTAQRVGWWKYRKLAAFQQEGYADHVAFNHAVDVGKGRRALMADAFEMSPQRSGLYARYELLVAYLLEKRGWTPDELLARPLDQKTVEAELLARTDL